MNRPATIRTTAAVLLLAAAAAACSDEGSATTSTSTPASPATTTSPDQAAPALLLDSDAEVGPAPHALRQRAAGVDLSVLLRADGRARPVTEITINLFPDTTFTGVISGVTEQGNGYTWTGHLEGVEPSSLTMVWTGSAFIGQFAGPPGVFEVSGTGTEGVFKVVEIDQNDMPGEF